MNMPEIIIIVENPKYSGNTGMIARLIANFGLAPLRIVGPRLEPDFEMSWMATHAETELNRIIYYNSATDARNDLDLLIGTGMIRGKDRGEYLDAGSVFRKKITETAGRVGIAFGREDRGLSREFIDHCDYMVDFNLPGEQKSMNLSHSVAYVMGLVCPIETDIKNKNESSTADMKEFYKYASVQFERLGLNDFHGIENLAIKRFKKILGTELSEGDRDFLFKIFRMIDEKTG